MSSDPSASSKPPLTDAKGLDGKGQGGNGSSENGSSAPHPHDPSMPLQGHLDELRVRLVRSLVAILILFVGALTFSSEIINFLQGPLRGALPELPPDAKALNFTGPMDVFITSLKVSFLVAIIGGSPIWLFQFWRFVEPALFPEERKYVLPFAFASVVLFFAGIAFCYLTILPMALTFLIGLGSEVGNAIITINDYFSLLTILILGFGLIFETPVILVLLACLGLIDSTGLRSQRQLVLIGILVVGALITPPDPISQLGVAVPMYVMFELSILIIALIEGKDKTSRSKKPSSESAS